MKKISENEIEKWMQRGFKRDQILKCKDAFDLFDLNDNEYIEIDELRAALQNMGHQPTEEELYRMMNEGDRNGTGECKISFDNFMSIIYEQKRSVEDSMKGDVLNAFQALGGDINEGHGIDLEKVREIVKREFDMDIDMNKFVRSYQEGDKASLSFQEFMDLMTN